MYRVNEIFYSLQGEGYNAGRAALFVRFSGCNRKCSFCDTDFSHFTEMSADDILSRLRQELANAGIDIDRCEHLPMVVLTGGEPALQADRQLVNTLHEHGFYVAMETNGSVEVADNIDWITVSPKGETAVRVCDELKLVYTGEGTPQDNGIVATYRYLQPCDTGNEKKNREITEACVEYIKEHPQWMLSLQTHKLINIK